ncbi:hypothetical protein AtNW77_Chr4g0280771 [Arabidopsis thaliana]
MVKNKQLQPLVTSSTSHLWRRSRWKSSHQLRRINENRLKLHRQSLLATKKKTQVLHLRRRRKTILVRRLQKLLLSIKIQIKSWRLRMKSDWFERSFVGGAFKELDSGVDEETWKKNWSLVPVKKRNRIEEKVKSVQADELKTMWEKIDVVHEARSLMAKYVYLLLERLIS